MTRFTRFMDGIMEAVWLLAVMMAPLFFNQYTYRTFEPDKAALFRTLILIGAAAWLLKGLEDMLSSGAKPFTDFNLKVWIKKPFALPIFLVVLSYLISSILSVVPRLSFMGSEREMGLYSLFSFMLLFGMVAAQLRTQVQLRRLVSVIILASLPVSLYAMLQHYGIDPINWAAVVENRVSSTLGNPIFLGAYLILVIPLSLTRLIEAGKAVLNEAASRLDTLKLAAYVIISLSQIFALLYTGSRGPLLGLLAGLFVMFFLLSIYWRARWLALGMLAGALVLGLFLIVLNIPAGPLEPLRSGTPLAPLARIFETGSGSGRVRVLIWEGAAEMAVSQTPLPFPDGSVDRLAAVRPLVGYGPETMLGAFNPFYRATLANIEIRGASPDRAHNDIWDIVITNGVLGLTAFVLFYAAIFFFGLKWLGLIATQLQARLFWVFFVGSAAALTAGFGLILGWPYFGIALTVGIVVGLVLYLIYYVLANNAWGAGEEQPAQLVVIALLAGIVAYLIETSFGIGIVTTRAFFWIFSAMLFVAGTRLLPAGTPRAAVSVATSKQPRPASKKRRQAKPPSDGLAWFRFDRPVLTVIALVVALLLPVCYAFINNLSAAQPTAVSVVFQSLAATIEGQSSFGVLLLLVITWLVSILVLLADQPEQNAASFLRSFTSATLGSLVVLFFYVLLVASTLSLTTRMPNTTIEEILNITRLFAGLLTQFYFFVILTLLCLAFFLPTSIIQKNKAASATTYAAAFVLMIGVLWLAGATNIRTTQADTDSKQGVNFAADGQWLAAVELHNNSVAMAPNRDNYYLFLSQAYLGYAMSLSEPEDVAANFEKAAANIEQAQQLSPLNADYAADLALLHRWWAGQAANEQESMQRGMLADQYFEYLLSLSPNRADNWGEWAVLDINILNQPEAALPKLDQGLALEPDYHWLHSLYGDAFFKLARQSAGEEAAAPHYLTAAGYYQHAFDTADSSVRSGEQGLYYIFSLVNCYQSLGDMAQMVVVLEEGLAVTKVASEIWQIEKKLASGYFQLADKESALAHAQAALAAAPDPERPAIQSMLDSISISSP